MRIGRLMTQEEYKGRLSKLNLQERKFLRRISDLTGSIIEASQVRNRFHSQKVLSEVMSALFRYAFMEIERNLEHVREQNKI